MLSLIRKSRIVKFRKPKINPTIIEPVDDIFKDQGFDSITSRVPILPKEKVKKIPVSKVKTVNKKSKVVAKKTPRNKTKKK